uniref:Solute carrier family 4 member 11 n=1 Tax=Fundulus heteroclitus TaxID=8078 RepID=A0A3Q2T0L8_FUNHE
MTGRRSLLFLLSLWDVKDTNLTFFFCASIAEAPPSGMSKNGYFFQEMEQREVEQEEGSECREEGQDLPIACGEDIHLYDNQISPGPDADDSGCVLLNTSRRYVKLMNFEEEVRAHRDLDGFLARASILLDETAASLDDVLKRMLHHVGEDSHVSEPGCNFEEVMSMLFTDAGAQEVNVHLLSETIQGVTATATGVQYQQSWLCILCNVKHLQRRHVCISRLERPQNWGENCCEVRYVILILAPSKMKSTKTAMELGRTFGTLFSDISFRQKLLETKTQEEFKEALVFQRHQLTAANQQPIALGKKETVPRSHKPLKVGNKYHLYYHVVIKKTSWIPLDCIVGSNKTLLKYMTTAIFLYIAILLPAIAFGSLNDESTRGEIGMSMQSGCRHSCVFFKHGWRNFAKYFKVFPFSKFIFVITICALVSGNTASAILHISLSILSFGFSWVVIEFSHYLHYSVTSMIHAFFSPCLALSFFPVFRVRDRPIFIVAPFERLSAMNVISAMGLGFLLALLIFIDQNIVVSLTNAPENRLLKGTAYHWDLMLSGLINILMSVLGLPWMHAAFPHSTLHVRQLAFVEQRVEGGHLYETIVQVKETRLTSLAANIFIGVSVLLLPVPLQWIPKPVLYGLFLYIALTSIDGNQMCDRMALLLKEQVRKGFDHMQFILMTILCKTNVRKDIFKGNKLKSNTNVVCPVFRNNVLPHIIEAKYLDIMDAQHM